MKKLLLFVLYISCTLGWAQMENEGHFEQNLGDSKALTMELGTGTYEIQPGTSDKVTVVYRTGNTRGIGDIKVSLTTAAQKGLLKIGGAKNIDATIEIPKAMGLSVKLATGNMDVKGIEGDKEFDLGTGTVKVDMISPDQYADIDASVKVGEVDGGSLGHFYSVGGSSLRKRGPGKYNLYAHVKVGNVILYSRDGQ
ncbi:MAG TPA: hypothetical protein VK722_09755 [Candidatus Aquilonibacter sp.]|nr:hypothetical protein [Candidatus Aquilonibacter sp.]